jgi:hypothetical protein
LEPVQRGKERMLFCTRRNSRVAHVKGLLDVRIEGIVCPRKADWSAGEVVEVHGTEPNLVEGRHFEPVGSSGLLGEGEEVVVERSEVVVVLRMAGALSHDHQGNLSDLLEGEVHVLAVAKGCIVGTVVDTRPTGGAGDQDTVLVRQDCRCGSVL